MADVDRAALVEKIAAELGISQANGKRILEVFEHTYVQPLLDQLRSRGIRQLLSRKNPYLYRASGVATCEELVERAFADYLSSSTETLFGNFLEAVAVIVSGGYKSATQGIDIERRVGGGGTRVELYVLKSGPAGFNSASLRDAERALQTAEALLRQGGVTAEKFIAFAYGRKKTSFLRGIHRLSSQELWRRIGGRDDFYICLLRMCALLGPLYQADIQVARQRLLDESRKKFCLGSDIDWEAVLEAASG